MGKVQNNHEKPHEMDSWSFSNSHKCKTAWLCKDYMKSIYKIKAKLPYGFKRYLFSLSTLEFPEDVRIALSAT